MLLSHSVPASCLDLTFLFILITSSIIVAPTVIVSACIVILLMFISHLPVAAVAAVGRIVSGDITQKSSSPAVDAAEARIGYNTILIDTPCAVEEMHVKGNLKIVPCSSTIMFLPLLKRALWLIVSFASAWMVWNNLYMASKLTL